MLGKNSDIQIRQQRRDALREADLVILAGETFCCHVCRDFLFTLYTIANVYDPICFKFEMHISYDHFTIPDNFDLITFKMAVMGWDTTSRDVGLIVPIIIILYM